MNSLPTYLLETSICLFIFYGYYSLLLANRTTFQFNRVYLLVASVGSILFPLVKFQVSSNRLAASNMEYVTPMLKKTVYVRQHIASSMQQETYFQITIGDCLSGIYFIGVMFMIFNLIMGLHRVFRVIRKGKRQYRDGICFIDSGNIPASSFFTYIFWNPGKINSVSGKAIYEHEKVHVKQWHSLDVMIMEIIVAIKWFNPLIYLYRNALRKTHEFIADRYVSQKMGSNKKYAKILYQQLYEPSPLQHTHGMSAYIKERLFMLQRKQRKNAPLLPHFLCLPIFIMVFGLFSFDLSDELPMADSIAKAEKSINTIVRKPLFSLDGKTSYKTRTAYQFSWGEVIKDGFTGKDTLFLHHFLDKETSANLFLKSPEIKMLQDVNNIDKIVYEVTFKYEANREVLRSGVMIPEGKKYKINDANFRIDDPLACKKVEASFRIILHNQPDHKYRFSINITEEETDEYYEKSEFKISLFNRPPKTSYISRNDVRNNVSQDWIEIEEFKKVEDLALRVYDINDKEVFPSQLSLTISRLNMSDIKEFESTDLEIFQREKGLPDQLTVQSYYNPAMESYLLMENYSFDLKKRSEIAVLLRTLKSINSHSYVYFNLQLEEGANLSYGLIVSPKGVYNNERQSDLLSIVKSEDVFSYQFVFDNFNKSVIRYNPEDQSALDALEKFKSSDKYSYVPIKNYTTKTRIENRNFSDSTLQINAISDHELAQINPLELPTKNKWDDFTTIKWGKLSISNNETYWPENKTDLFWSNKMKVKINNVPYEVLRYDVSLINRDGKTLSLQKDNSTTLKSLNFTTEIKNTNQLFINNIVIEENGQLYTIEGFFKIKLV